MRSGESPNQWVSLPGGIFSCHEDIGTCLYGLCCPCCLFGRNANAIDGSNCFTMACSYCCLDLCLLCFLVHKTKREKLRNEYDLIEEPNDCLATWIFSYCALCQESRELSAHGESSSSVWRSVRLVHRCSRSSKISESHRTIVFSFCINTTDRLD